MRRQENQSFRPTSGCVSVPLFNQKRRNRVPLTSAPSANEFFSHSEYMANTSSATAHTPGTYGSFQPSGLSPGASQSEQWNRHGAQQSPQPQKFDSRPAPGPAPTTRAPMPHPYKVGITSSNMGQPSYPVGQQDSSCNIPSSQNKYQSPFSSEDAQGKPTPHAGFSQVGRQSTYRLPSPTQQHPRQPRPLPPPVPPPVKPVACAAQPKSNSWKFTNSFGSQATTNDCRRIPNQPQTAQPPQTQKAFLMKPAPENSLRILTAVIDGMRHWSQFKDKVPYLFEIFATLDSAVTLGLHGAKTFLMRDGKQALQCVFYENEKELPRLVRGQVHRCVGNYDRSRDVLVCISIRPGLPSELRNAHEAVRACDAEMRALVKSLREV